MKIVSGVDLVYIPRFKKALKSGGENFLRRVFNENELQRHLENDVQHLAGIFAAKESIIKALSMPTESWHEICITYNKNCAPTAQIENYKLFASPRGEKIENCSLSISHDENYVIAQFLAIIIIK